MILTGSAQEHRIMSTSGIPLTRIDEILQWSMNKNSFKEPWKYYEWIVIGNAPDSDVIVPERYWTEKSKILERYYHIEYKNIYYKILRRI